MSGGPNSSPPVAAPPVTAPPVTALPVARRVEPAMDTAVSLVASGADRTSIDDFFGRIRDLEALFSRFRPSSEISLLVAGRLGRDEVAPEVREVLARCDQLRELTDGAYDHEPSRRAHRGEAPVLDVDAVAKGWIIEEAAMGLRLCGADILVNAGGDVVVARRAGAPPRRVGVQDPADPRSVISVLSVTRSAVATSGTYQRGQHIRTDRPGALLSVTVVGPDLAWADGLATAVLAAGIPRPRWWSQVDPDYGLLVLTPDRQRHWIPPQGADPAEVG